MVSSISYSVLPPPAHDSASCLELSKLALQHPSQMNWRTPVWNAEKYCQIMFGIFMVLAFPTNESCPFKSTRHKMYWSPCSRLISIGSFYPLRSSVPDSGSTFGIHRLFSMLMIPKYRSTKLPFFPQGLPKTI